MLSSNYVAPVDHLPASVRDRDCIRREDEIDRRKTLFRQARAVSNGLRTITDRQQSGKLHRSDGAVLAAMILQNLRACVRGERMYRPTRKRLAKVTGYSERSVSRSIARLKEAGIIVVSAYGKGGRNGDRGKGFSTEFRSGCLQLLCDQLAALGYRLGKSLHDDLADLARWAASQVGEHTEVKADVSEQTEPTGTPCPGIIGKVITVAPGEASVAPVADGVRAPRKDDPAVDVAPGRVGAAPVARSARGEPPRVGAHRPATTDRHILSKQHDVSHERSVVSDRPPVGKLARLAMGADLVPMPQLLRGGGTAGGSYSFALNRSEVLK